MKGEGWRGLGTYFEGGSVWLEGRDAALDALGLGGRRRRLEGGVIAAADVSVMHVRRVGMEKCVYGSILGGRRISSALFKHLFCGGRGSICTGGTGERHICRLNLQSAAVKMGVSANAIGDGCTICGSKSPSDVACMRASCRMHGLSPVCAYHELCDKKTISITFQRVLPEVCSEKE